MTAVDHSPISAPQIKNFETALLEFNTTMFSGDQRIQKTYFTIWVSAQGRTNFSGDQEPLSCVMASYDRQTGIARSPRTVRHTSLCIPTRGPRSRKDICIKILDEFLRRAFPKIRPGRNECLFQLETERGNRGKTTTQIPINRPIKNKFNTGGHTQPLHENMTLPECTDRQICAVKGKDSSHS